MTLKKAFRPLLFLFALAISVLAQIELVKNGNFSSGATNWTLNQYGGSSSGSVQSGEYRIVVTTAGTEHWHVQFIQTALALVQGKSYTFAFDAYKGTQNSGTQSMQVNIGQSQSPYTSYFGGQANMVALTTTKTRYTYTINMTSASDQNARIEFNCGKSTGGFYIDNVSLAETVTGPHLSAVPLTINFGEVLAGATGTANVTLQNNSGAAATVSAVQSSSGSFSTNLTVPATVPAAGSLILPVTFSPVAAGSFSGAVTIYSNATDNPTITVNCSGTSVLPGMQFTPASMNFSAAPGEAVSQTITMSNTASTSLTWGLTSSGSWATVTPTSGTIAAGAQIVCNVTVSHAATGTYNGTLTLTHSASNIPSPSTIPVSLTVSAGYQPTCPYIQNPETAIDFIRDLAAFRMRQRDNTNGGFFTNIDRQGNSTGANEKALCGQSRIAYAFVRAFMVTGEEQYLEYAHHALKFLYDHGWNNGWYFITDLAGNHVSHWGHDDWWSFQQHYALVGVSAMVEATGGKMNWNDGSESDHAWLMRGVNLNYTKLWDSNPTTKGYFDRANTAWSSKWGKGFHATVDGITTHALLMRMMYDSLNHRNRFVELSNNVVDHLIGGMSQAAAGFPEVYTADWSVDNSVTSMDIGHGFKTAWVLQRAYLLHPDHPEYLAAAQALMQNLWENGCYDEVNGAPYSYLNWQTGEVTGTNKDFWMVEQGFTSGMMSYYTAQSQELRDRYLLIADGSLNFFMDHLMDPVYGESYNVVSRDGSTVVDANKGGLFTAGYHSTELGYYTYLYSSLYYHKTPVSLYYYYPAENTERTIKLTPVAIEDNVLKITAVTRDGNVYADFNPDARTLHLPSGVGGKFRVTFGFTSATTWTITATAGTGGSVSPLGATTVTEGNSQSFTITPASGYRIGDVLVDGTSAGTVASYTFTNVAAAHTIEAAFAPLPTYTITAIAGAGGAISPSGATSVVQGGSQTYAITPSSGYRIAGVLVDGVSAGTVSTFTFTNVTAVHTISATFSLIPATVYRINCGSGSAVSPFTADQYGSGGTQHSVTNAITITGITSPAPQAVYQSERYGASTYTLPGLTSGASYTVRLHFAELYQTATGRRVFNVAINGTTVLSNFDVYAVAGARYKAVLREFTATANASGQIVIVFTTITDNATISGIEILPAIPNDPPTIATAASATPGVVTGTTTALSVLGADDNGESALTYTWATKGTSPAALTFSANGTNAAKATTATFTKAGSYTLQATIRDAGNLTVTSTVAVTVNQTLTSVVVSPSSASVAKSATQQFTATARDQFSTNLTVQPTFTWSVSGGGTISSGGLFSAGIAAGGPYTVSATSGGVSGTASVTVTAVATPVYRINCGSASAASPFTADQYASGGTQRTVTNAITITGITNPAPQAVYQSERYGAGTYTLPNLTPGASYTVRLHFAELYQTATGRRVFNVGVNGTTVLSNFDVYAVAGARYKAVLREFTVAANASGQIVINLATVTDNATISGIEVIRN